MSKVCRINAELVSKLCLWGGDMPDSCRMCVAVERTTTASTLAHARATSHEPQTLLPQNMLSDLTHSQTSARELHHMLPSPALPRQRNSSKTKSVKISTQSHMSPRPLAPVHRQPVYTSWRPSRRPSRPSGRAERPSRPDPSGPRGRAGLAAGPSGPRGRPAGPLAALAAARASGRA